MKYYVNSHLLFRRGFGLESHDLTKAPNEYICYNFDYDCRKPSANMEFPHFHTFFEIMILLSPKAYHFVEGKRYDIQANDVVLLAPSILHQSEYLPGDESDRIIIAFTLPKHHFAHEKAFREALSVFESPCPVFRLNEQDQEILFRPLNEILLFSQQCQESDILNLFVHSKMTEFLLIMYSMRKKNLYTPSNSKGVREKIYTITNYIHMHYSEDLSLNSLSETFFISPYYLSHQFKEVTSYTVVQYVQLTRIRNAQYLLLNSDEKITHIAEMTGFSSFSQFNRVFRKFCGMSPSDYKTKSRPAPYKTAFSIYRP